MNLDDSNLPPLTPPMALPYSSLAPTRPGIITAVAVIGIVMASLGFIVAAFGAVGAASAAFFGRAVPAMRWQTPGAMTVNLCDAAVGAALATALLFGSIGLLRLRPWSRRILIRWAWVYLVSVAVFLFLQLTVVVPSQVAMVATMMKTMTPPVPAATMPVVGVSTTGVTTFTYNATSYSSAVPPSTAATMAPAMSMMKVGYIVAAVGRAIISLIFPIAVLIVMRLQSIRSALAPV